MASQLAHQSLNSSVCESPSWPEVLTSLPTLSLESWDLLLSVCLLMLEPSVSLLLISLLVDFSSVDLQLL